MRCVLVSLGTLGDLHPFVALALAFRAMGHEPVLAAAAPCRPIAERHGIPFQAVRPEGAQVMVDTGMDEAESAVAVANDLGFVVERVILPYADKTLADLMPLMANADVVVCSSFSVLGRIAAEASGVPVVSVLLQPMAIVSADDPPVLPNGSRALITLRRHLGPWTVRAALRLTSAISRLRFRRFGDIRRRLGAPPFRGDELIDGPSNSALVIGLWSAAFSPPPIDAPANFSVTGFTFYDGGFAGTSMPSAVADFLEGGDPPIVFTLGSFAVYADDGFYAASAKACRILGLRAILLVGEDLVERHRHLADTDTLVAGYVPHSMLFDRAAVVVHHGGIGTIAQAMRAGVPQLVSPIFGDQFDNAARIERSGLGRTLSRSDYMPDRVADALGAIIADRSLLERVRERSLELRGEDGAAATVSLIASQIKAQSGYDRSAHRVTSHSS